MTIRYNTKHTHPSPRIQAHASNPTIPKNPNQSIPSKIKTPSGNASRVRNNAPSPPTKQA